MTKRAERTQARIDALEREIDDVKLQIRSKPMSKQRPVYEWWISKSGKGAYHERIGSNITVVSETYSRGRDARRAAYRHAARSHGSSVRQIDPPKK